MASTLKLICESLNLTRVKPGRRGSEEVQDSREPEGTQVAWDPMVRWDSRCVIMVLCETRMVLGFGFMVTFVSNRDPRGPTELQEFVVQV